MSKKLLITALVGVAAIGLSSAAFASDIYVGAQAGYGDTHWSDAEFNENASFAAPNLVGNLAIWNISSTLSAKDTGFAGRLFAGVDFNQFLAVESGFTYFPKTKLTMTDQTTITDLTTGAVTTFGTSGSDSFNTYGIDVLGKISVPLANNFGLYAKAGPGYLRTQGNNSNDGSVSNFDLVYGFGADYQITPHLVADASFTRFNGNHKTNDNDFQPDADLYALGLAYKFNV